VFTKFLRHSVYYAQYQKLEGEIMDYLMDILYVGGITGFFLLMWAMVKACEKLGDKA